jgi:F-type H+-transporting ATPase subunit alpha
MDSIPVADIRRFEGEFLDYVSHSHASILEVISSTRELSDDTVAALEKAIESFKSQFAASAGK